MFRAHYQMLVWNKDTVANPELPSPQGYGWRFEENELHPIMSTQLPAPEDVIHLVKCASVKSRCSTSRCRGRKACLGCTDLCSCSESEDECENTERVTLMDGDDDDAEEDEKAGNY
jgi:hypothetical protein